MFRKVEEDEKVANAPVMTIARSDLVSIIQDRLRIYASIQAALKRGDGELDGSSSDVDGRAAKRRKKLAQSNVYKE